MVTVTTLILILRKREVRYSSYGLEPSQTGDRVTKCVMVWNHVTPEGRVTQCGDSDDSDTDSEEERGKI